MTVNNDAEGEAADLSAHNVKLAAFALARLKLAIETKHFVEGHKRQQTVAQAIDRMTIDHLDALA